MIGLFESWARPTIRYCEANLSGWIVQPANAFSSLFISLAGIIILVRKRHEFASYLGSVALILGFASFFYYMSFTFVGQLADLGSMFLLMVLISVIGLKDRITKTSSRLLLLIFGTAIPLTLTIVFRTIAGFNLGIPLFGILIITAVILEIKRCRTDKINPKYFWLAFVLLGVAFVFWLLDYKQIWCSPGSFHFVNGHAVWHLFNAFSLIALDQHYAASIKNLLKPVHKKPGKKSLSVL